MHKVILELQTLGSLKRVWKRINQPQLSVALMIT